MNEMKTKGKENAVLFCVGKKGYEYFYKRDYTILGSYKDFWMNLVTIK